jgi:hypothetical protein
MDLETARAYAEAILATCEMADGHADALQSTINQ